MDARSECYRSELWLTMIHKDAITHIITHECFQAVQNIRLEMAMPFFLSRTFAHINQDYAPHFRSLM
jgi:hypothetical protein